MKNWKETVIDLGVVPANTTHKLEFIGNVGLPDIKKIEVSCGCTKAKFDSKARVMKVTYKAGNVPNHVLTGLQPISQAIAVQYVDNSIEVLSIKGVKQQR